MKILVLLKETPDTETKIKISGDKMSFDETGYKYIISPYDEYAIEEALKLKDKDAGTEVVVCTFGPETAKERMIKALAMGADRGILVSNKGCERADSVAVAKLLAAVIKAENPDLVFGGKQAIDKDDSQTISMTAEFLDWPHINVATKFTLEGKRALVERSVEGGQVEVYDVALPFILGADKTINSPRYASLPGIMKAKKKPLDIKSPSDFGHAPDTMMANSTVTAASFDYPPAKPPGKIFKGEDVAVMVGKVAKLLRDEAKVI